MEIIIFKFILTSSSPRWNDLLVHTKYPFVIMSLNETKESSAEDPVEFSSEISALKGLAVYNLLRNENPDSSFFVVSSDTIVSYQGKIYGKPNGRDEARKILKELSGNTHSVFTAVTVKVL